jgi:hypothetical protein
MQKVLGSIFTMEGEEERERERERESSAKRGDTHLYFHCVLKVSGVYWNRSEKPPSKSILLGSDPSSTTR